MAALRALEHLGVIVTAPGTRSDFVSRYFAPRIGLPEDAVTGSAHATLAPYWAARLGHRRLHARQLSARGGELTCEDRDTHVRLAAQSVRYAQGTLYL
jgi:predicted PhzF superfamily epimerase YddE/YHI9